MKIFLRILGILALLVALLFSAGGYKINSRDAAAVADDEPNRQEALKQLAFYKEIEKSLSGEKKEEAAAEIKKLEKQIDELPTESTLTTLSYLFIVIGIFSIIIAVFLFIPRVKIAQVLLGLAIVLFAITYFLSPDLHSGSYSGVSNDTAALLAGGPLVLMALFNFLISRITLKKQALALA